MTKRKWILRGTLAVVAAVGALGLYPLLAQNQPAQESKDQDKTEAAAMAAVRKTADAFTRAFNAGDAKAVAAFWTKDCEFIDADGDITRGRADIEKTYVELFQKHPKARIEIDIDSVRILSRFTALEEGRLKIHLPGAKEPGVSRYSVLHVREDEGWQMASVREWTPDPHELITVKDVDWLIGTWTAKGPETEVRLTFAWDEDKAFLRGRYTMTRKGQTFNSGTKIIGKNPEGGLRSWVFDKNGGFGEAVWEREENRWLIEEAGTLPDGSKTTSVNILIPLGPDSFTWQSVDRTAAGSDLPDTPPVKVTRVKAAQ